MLVFLLAFSLTVWSCGGNTSDDSADQTEMTEDAEHPEGEHPAADSTATDSTSSEHPEGGEHPSGEHPSN